MPSTREIRNKIRSVKSTQQITKAMKMVAAARMRRAQNAIMASRPFAVKMEGTVGELTGLEKAAGRMHPFFVSPASPPEGEGPAPAGRRPAPALGLVLITADKGLCGSFNATLIREALRWIRERQDRRILVSAVGRKGRDFLRRVDHDKLERGEELVNIFPKVNFAHAELVAKPMIKAFEKGELESVTVIFNEFKSAVSQKVNVKTLLPIPIPEGQGGGDPFGFKYEPDRERLLDALLPRYIKAQFYRILLESQAAELAARMNAMEAATKNAGELIEGLTLTLNRTRQTIITNEIMEIVGGAEALAG